MQPCRSVDLDGAKRKWKKHIFLKKKIKSIATENYRTDLLAQMPHVLKMQSVIMSSVFRSVLWLQLYL